MASNANLTDWKWMNSGGILCDGTGDISFTLNNADGMQTMMFSRLKGDLNAYKLYAVCADLDSLIGSVPNAELETAIQKQVSQSLSNQFLQTSDFTVETISVGTVINIFVYIQGSLIATMTVTVS